MKRIISIVFLLGLVGILLLSWAMFGDHSSFQTGLKSYEGIPSTASDITVYRNNNISGVFLADFKMIESDFVSYAAENKWAINVISNSELVFYAKAFQEGRPNDKKEIGDGFYYSQHDGNGGGVTVGYDRKEGRAYFERSAR